jgi:hypothetical protein
VRGQTHLHALAGIVLLGALVCSNAGYAQESLADPQLPSPPGPVEQRTTTNYGAPCVEPPPLVRLQDYDGPLKKTVGLFARQLERKSVRPPHYRPGLMLCSLDLGDKFFLFVRDSFDPVTFIASAFNAGLDQAENRDPSFGQGGAGYSQRFAANFADQASFKFFRDFAYPSIFSEDPRYYRLGEGNRGRRFLHALDHAFVAHRDTGARMFNFSEWLGTTSFVTLSNVYHPGNERGVAPAARLVGYNIVEDMGFDVLREFWPEIARKFRLPFRTEPPPGFEANSVAQ